MWTGNARGACSWTILDSPRGHREAFLATQATQATANVLHMCSHWQSLCAHMRESPGILILGPCMVMPPLISCNAVATLCLSGTEPLGFLYGMPTNGYTYQRQGWHDRKCA